MGEGNNTNGVGEGNNEENIYQSIDDTSAAASDAASASAPTSMYPNESFVRDETTIGFDQAQQNMIDAERVVSWTIECLGLARRHVGEDGIIELESSGPESIETRTPETDSIIEAAGTVVNSLVTPVEAYLETALDDPY